MTNENTFLNISQSGKANDNTIASIIAFFLSKYNERALNILGYRTNTEAFNELSKLTGSKPNYIKLRRDEFDIYFPGGPRQGWNKRPPTLVVSKFHNELNALSFDELYFKIKTLLEMLQYIEPQTDSIIHNEIKQFSELDIENIINFKDQSAAYKLVSRQAKIRILDSKITDKLKIFYNYRCQICGQRYYDTYSVNISEGHHILPFIESLNNNASNIIILCPNHHRLMHIAKPLLNISQKIFTYPNGYIEQIQINDHL